jgi:uncharacterized LabA/DUF88 family protein
MSDLPSFLPIRTLVVYYDYPPGDSISGPTPTRKGGSSLFSTGGDTMTRVITYIDGFNLYYGLRSKGWRYFYWLDVRKMSRHMLKSHQTLVRTKYFTSIIDQPEDKHDRQAVYLEAPGTLSDLDIFLGHYLATSVTCKHCGQTHRTHHEKMTDVNIAVEMMADAVLDKFDLALLVSADSDLVGPVHAVQRLFSAKRVVVAFPPDRSSYALKQAAYGHTSIGRDGVSKSVFPDQVIKPDGFVLNRPDKWRWPPR